MDIETLRITDDFPLTATPELDKAMLRRTGWCTDDPVYGRVDGTYRLLDGTAAARLADEFRAHDRAQLLPA